jgi:hypothetical protein
MGGEMPLESDFQAKLTADLKNLFPGCLVIKGNSASRQGIPDWLILYGDRWAALEVKKAPNAKRQPNQPYYVDLMNDMSFAAFIYPENAAHVVDALQNYFGA